MKGFNFGLYLRNYEILQIIGKNKTRKQFKNFLRVFYGKKKDRGYIKIKIEKQIEENFDNRKKIFSFISKQFPLFGEFSYFFNVTRPPYCLNMFVTK